MALSANTIFEVRGGSGSDTNGGGFVTGASGTDYSQQNSAQYALTGLTSSGAGAVILTASAATDMVGNIIYIVSGTNFTVGWYEITSVSAGVSITVDRSVTTGAGASGVGNIGGAFNTINTATAIMTVTGMQVYVKATATYSISSSITVPSGIALAGFNRIIGYTTTRSDRGQPTIQPSAAVTSVSFANAFWRLENFIVNGNSTGTTGISVAAATCFIFNCKVMSCTGTGIDVGGSGVGIERCIVTGCAKGVRSSQISGYYKSVICYANSGPGFEVINNGEVFIDCISAANTGASGDGFIINAAYSSNRCILVNCIAYGNARDGYRNTGNYYGSGISNCIFVNNTGIGLNTSAMSPVRDSVLYYNNAFYGNGTARSGNNAGIGDVTLTGNPFVDAPNRNFALNNTAGAGAALRGVGFPGTLDTSTGYSDIGPYQHQDPASGGAWTFVG